VLHLNRDLELTASGVYVLHAKYVFTIVQRHLVSIALDLKITKQRSILHFHDHAVSLNLVRTGFARASVMQHSPLTITTELNVGTGRVMAGGLLVVAIVLLTLTLWTPSTDPLIVPRTLA